MARLDLPADDPDLLAHRVHMVGAFTALVEWRRRFFWPFTAALLVASLVAAGVLHYAFEAPPYLILLPPLAALAIPLAVNGIRTRRELRHEPHPEVEQALTRALRSFQAEHARTVTALRAGNQVFPPLQGMGAGFGVLLAAQGRPVAAGVALLVGALGFAGAALVRRRQDKLEALMAQEGIAALSEEDIPEVSRPQVALQLVLALVLASFAALLLVTQ